MPVVKILDRDGKQVSTGPHCQQVIPKEVADAAADAARCPVGDGPSSDCDRGNGVTAASVGRAIDRPIAGKTGTTDGNRSAWFVGFTPNLAEAAFIANPDVANDELTGGQHDIPIAIFKQTMTAALAYVPVKDFVDPPNSIVNGQQVSIPNVEGMDPQDAKDRLERAGFKARINQQQVPSQYPAGKVAKTSPSGSASKGGVVAIFVSNGQPDPSKNDPNKPGGVVLPPPPRHRHRGGGGLLPIVALTG
jgi:membrane peptidoglycan carboxypeptidase